MESNSRWKRNQQPLIRKSKAIAKKPTAIARKPTAVARRPTAVGKEINSRCQGTNNRWKGDQQPLEKTQRLVGRETNCCCPRYQWLLPQKPTAFAQELRAVAKKPQPIIEPKARVTFCLTILTILVFYINR